MLRKSLLWYCIIAVFLICVFPQKKLYYLHNQQNFTASPEVEQLSQNEFGIPLMIINCNQKQCAKYKASPTFPQLLYWNGPGSSYKQLTSQNVDGLRLFIQKVNSNPIKPIRDFLEGITLLQSFGVALVLGGILYTIFTTLFTDKSKISDKKKTG